MTLHRASRYTLALALLGLPAVAGAQAFGLNEIGSCATARGFAATASPCDDASSIYWNPGAMQKARGFSLYGGVAAIALEGAFTRDSLNTRYDADVPTAYVPHLFVNYRTAGKSAFGLGVYVPYGLTSQWRENFPGRFSARKASLQTIYVQPNFSYQIAEGWSVGGGPVIGHSTVELIQGVDLSAQRANATATFGMLGIPRYTQFAEVALKGSAMAYGFDVGLHGQITPTWQMGLRVLSQLSFNYDNADATFTQTPTGLVLPAGNVFGVPAGTSVDALVAGQFSGTGPLQAQKVQTQIRHPAQVQAGVAYSGFQSTTLSAEYSYVGWKSFNQLPVNFGTSTALNKVLQEDYNNTSGIRLGAEHRLVSGVALRGGYMATAAAAPDETVTALLPEQDRQIGTLGAGLPFGGSYALDLGYAHIFTPGRRGRIDERRPSDTTPALAASLNSGVYTLNANVFMVSLKASF